MATVTSVTTSSSAYTSVRDLFDRASAAPTSAISSSDGHDVDRKVVRVQPVDTVRLSDAVQARILKRQGETVPQIAGSLNIPKETAAAYVEETATMLPSDSEQLTRLIRSKLRALGF